MKRTKKSDNINKNYPVLGFRVAKAERNEFVKEFNKLLEGLDALPEYRRVKLKKNALFLWILELGMEELKKQKLDGN